MGYLYRHDMFNKISFVRQHHDQELNGCDCLMLFLFVVCLLFPQLSVIFSINWLAYVVASAKVAFL